MSETIFEPRIEIVLENDCQRYYAGDTVKGGVEMVLDEDTPMGNVTISFHCIGEVKWVSIGSRRLMRRYSLFTQSIPLGGTCFESILLEWIPVL